MEDHKMKSFKIKYFAVTVLIILFIFQAAKADDRGNVFEMGESGYTIVFPSDKKNEKTNAAAGKTAAAKKIYPTSSSKPVLVFEMGESGYTVEFPMTAAEITVANAEKALIAARKSANPTSTAEIGDRFEMAESGFVFHFAAESKKMNPDDLAIGGNTPAQAVPGIDF